MVKLKYELPSETFDDLMRAMTAACSHIQAQICQDQQALLKNHTPTPSPNRTPSKPRRDNSSVSHSVSKSLSKSALKRKLSALEGAEQNTPSKRLAFMMSVPEVDEGEPSEDRTTGTLGIRRFANKAGAAVTPGYAHGQAPTRGPNHIEGACLGLKPPRHNERWTSLITRR